MIRCTYHEDFPEATEPCGIYMTDACSLKDPSQQCPHTTEESDAPAT